jgi:hypothetical protein
MSGRAKAVAGEGGVEAGQSPTALVARLRNRRRGGNLPACLRCAGQNLSAFTQQDRGDTGGIGGEIELAACQQIQRLGHAGHFQQQRSNWRAGENIAGGGQGFGGIGGADKNKILRPSAQFRHALGMKAAIFQRLVIRPHPEQGPPFSAKRGARGPDGETGGEAPCGPIPGVDFVQGPQGEAAAQRLVGFAHTQG